MKTPDKPTTLYLNEDANGVIYISKKPMNQTFYSTPVRLKCVKTNAKNITKKSVFIGAICVTIDNEIYKIIKMNNRCGYERNYVTN